MLVEVLVVSIHISLKNNISKSIRNSTRCDYIQATILNDTNGIWLCFIFVLQQIYLLGMILRRVLPLKKYIIIENMR